MRSRLIRSSIFMAVVPSAAIILSSYFKGSVTVQTAIVMLSAAIHGLVIFICQRDALRLIRPSIPILRKINTGHIPAPYEPGKYNIDFTVTGIMSYASVLAPAVIYIAKLRTVTTSSILTAFQPYEAPDPNLIILGIALMLLGPMSFCMWAKIGQAKVICDEGSDDKRYLYRAFAEDVEDSKKLYLYLAHYYSR